MFGLTSKKSIIKVGVLFLLFATVILGSCSKDQGSTQGRSAMIDALGEFDVRVDVVDIHGTPLSGLSVEIGERSISTDGDGRALAFSAELPTTRANIKVSGQGYFEGYATISPNSGVMNIVKVTLIERLVNGEFSSSIGGDVQLDGGARVSFGSNAIATNSGASYDGPVEVSMHHIDPTIDGWEDLMPGDLMAENSQGEEGVLLSYGMLAVELRSPDGQELQIADGQHATITVPVGASLLTSAPQTIPLWYYDDALGMWIEEGEAELIGNEYVGEVSHFSFWNCDDFASVVQLDGRVFNWDAVLAGASVRLTVLSNNFVAESLTDVNGEFSGLVPAEQIMLLEVSYSDCDVLFSEEIGPFSNDVSLSNVILQLNTLPYSGTLFDCDDQPLSGEVAYIGMGDGHLVQVVTDVNGQYFFNHLDCPEATNDFVDVYAPIENDVFHQPNSPVIDGVIEDIMICQGENTSSLNCAQELALDSYFSYCLNGEETILNPAGVQISDFEEGLQSMIVLYHEEELETTGAYNHFHIDLEGFLEEFNVGEYSIETGDSLGLVLYFNYVGDENDWNEEYAWLHSGFNALEGQAISQNNLDITITAYSEDPAAIEGSVACFVSGNYSLNGVSTELNDVYFECYFSAQGE